MLDSPQLRSVRDVAAKLGIDHERLRTWANAAQRGRPADLRHCLVMSGMELARLRRQVAELEPDREILKGSAVFFGRETGR